MGASMDYNTASKAPRRTGPDIIESTLVADERLILDPRGETRPRDIVEQRLHDLLGEAPLYLGESTWHYRSRVTTSALAPEKVGEMIGTLISPPPPPSSFPQQQDERSKEFEE
jgi:hypothetical protein